MNGSSHSRLAVLLIVAVSGSLFTALFGACIVLKAGSAVPWVVPDQPVHLIFGSLLIVVLAIGSFMLETAGKSLRRNDLMGLRATLLNTGAKGVAYLLLLAFQMSLLAGDRFLPTASTFAALFYVCWMFHMLHVLGGMAVVLPMAVRSRLPDPVILRNVTLFWHYTTALAVVLMLMFYVG